MKKIIYLHLALLFIVKISFAQNPNNYAASFNGINSYVAVPWHSEIHPTSAITVEAWVYPTSLPLNSGCIIGKNYASSYYFGIENTGRFIFFPKGGVGNFLRSRVSGLVRENRWTHIAGTYDGTTTRLYINGVLDTSRTGITGAVGTNFDSLFIGCDRSGSSPNFFFTGMLDNVRIWKSSRSASEILNNMYIPLSIYQLSGSYSFLAASYQFNNNADDNSGPAVNDGALRNVSFVDFTNKAVNHLDYNNNVVMNGTTDYCSHYNIGGIVNPTSKVTLECWIKRDTTGSQPTTQNLVNQSGGTTRYAFALFILNTGQVYFSINNGTFSIQTAALITNSQWTHIAANYNSTNGIANIYVNGDLKITGSFSGQPNINSGGTDSIFIGGIGATNYAANKFKGQLDEIRIWRTVRTQQQIQDNLFKHPFNTIVDTDSLVCFDFDYLHSGFQLNQTEYNYGLIYRGSSYLNSAHVNGNNKLSSPMLSDPSSSFYNQSFTSSSRRFFVPDASVTGITDSIFISGPGTVNNLKVYVMMSHTYTQDMILQLTSPAGTTINLLSAKGGSSNDIITVFSDDADSNAAAGLATPYGPGVSASFSPGIKPDQVLASFNGQSRNGYWRLKYIDQAGQDIGYVHSWGINLLPYKTLKVTALIEGFYNPATNKMIGDTAQMFFRIPLPPYPLVDSAKAVLDSNGYGEFNFKKVNNGYRVFKHRNSIETWTASPVPFSGDTSSYDFSSDSVKTYGGNVIRVDNSPLKFAIFGGDVNQDGIVDISDTQLIDNDIYAFVTGYVKTDLTGDNNVDISDAAIAENNSANIVSIVRP